MPNVHTFSILLNAENSYQLFLAVCFFSIHMHRTLFKEMSTVEAPTHSYSTLCLLCTLTKNSGNLGLCHFYN